jgi:hypothetical protein
MGSPRFWIMVKTDQPQIIIETRFVIGYSNYRWLNRFDFKVQS